MSEAKPEKHIYFTATLPIHPERVPRGTFYRLRVEVNRDEWGVEIAEEQVTSHNPQAQVLSDYCKQIDLMDDELIWLHSQLFQAMYHRGAIELQGWVCPSCRGIGGPKFDMPACPECGEDLCPIYRVKTP